MFAFLRQNANTPTFFVSLSMADTRWIELLDLLQEVSGNAEKKKDSESLTFDEKVNLIRNDPITCVRYFMHRRRSLFNHILLSKRETLGKIKDFFGVIEFQHRGSPHCHFLVWLENPPSGDSFDELVEFIDQYVSTDISVLSEQVQSFQSNMHSLRCQKKSKKSSKKIWTCAFGFPRPPFPRTHILSPLSERVTKEERKALRQKLQSIVAHLENPNLEEDISFIMF